MTYGKTLVVFLDTMVPQIKKDHDIPDILPLTDLILKNRGEFIEEMKEKKTRKGKRENGGKAGMKEGKQHMKEGMTRRKEDATSMNAGRTKGRGKRTQQGRNKGRKKAA